ncbi:MAG: hypothetical protein ACOWWM_18995 [Desulfobacterales bacterium]
MRKAADKSRLIWLDKGRVYYSRRLERKGFFYLTLLLLGVLCLSRLGLL